MAGADLTAPGLLVHVFLRAGPEAGEGWERLRSLWAAVTGRLGLDGPVPALATPPHLPHLPLDHVVADEPGLLAAAAGSEARAGQASAWADHGVLGLTVMMAPPRDHDGPGTWTDLERAWEGVTSGLVREGVLGETRILLARLARGDVTGRRARDLLVRTAVPEPARPGWWQHWDTVSGGPEEVLVWETGPRSGHVRRLVAVARVPSQDPAGQNPWPPADGSLAPLARHLMYAARLRDQVMAFGDGQRSRHLRDELSLIIDDVSGRPAGEAEPGQDRAGRDPLSARLRQVHEAAIALRTALAAMRDVASAITDSMRGALDLSPSDGAAGPLTEDRGLAAWFEQRLDDEITQLDAAIRNAQSVRRLVAGQAPARPAPRRVSPVRPQVVVFTALGVEYEAIRQYLAGPVRQHEERGTLYEMGVLPGVCGSWHVALTQTGPGSTTAGVQLDRAVRAFEPEIALFLGVAGGRKDVALGDVVAPDMIYDCEWGKSTLEGFQPRMRIHYPSHRLLQRARLVARENRWQQRIRPRCPEPPPASLVKPIVTGAKVIAHRQSAAAIVLDQYASDAVAVETEGHGFLEAAYVNPEVNAIVIRGISDLLIGKDQASDDYWQPVASRHAAAFAVELLDSVGSSGSRD